MFRALQRPLLAKVPYATLFAYNSVLQSVFASHAAKVAVTTELPGEPVQTFTYGQLQKDVVAAADGLVRRRDAVAQARREVSLSWAQPSKPTHVRSVFAQGERTPSCNYMHDVGSYTAALMCGPGYTYVVSLLACWAVNELVTPMSVSQRYDDELMYVLEHSGSRLLLGETALLKSKFPAEYDDLYVRRSSDIATVSANAAHRPGDTEKVKHRTYSVDSVLDMQMIMNEVGSARLGGGGELEPEHLPPHASRSSAMKSAEDVSWRVDELKEAAKAEEKERLEKLLKQQHKSKHALGSSDGGLCFDTDQLSELNPLFRQWYDRPESRPTRYDDCLMIYTSGTTARPKGAVHTHASVGNMVKVLQDAWEWSAEDSILHVLPVHHVHGLVNVLCSLASGARCVMTKFDNPVRIAHRLERGDITLFMAVPTIYTKLIAGINSSFSPIEKTGFKKVCAEQVRLMVSGSAALPVPTLNQFREISGHTLLERYGMTEIGMALSQPLRPVAERVPGSVGSPLPTVEALVYHPRFTEGDDQPSSSTAERDEQFEEVGALAIASESLFDRYWNNPTATRKELRVHTDGRRFFDTGDTVGVTHPHGPPKAGAFTILGRSSIDIIKSRGYKLSALEIEAALLSRKDLFYEIAVVGSKDNVLGEAVVAIVALQPAAAKDRGIEFSESCKSIESEKLTAEFKSVALKVLAPYKCPRTYICVPEIPRNPTGKVNKKNLKIVLNLP